MTMAHEKIKMEAKKNEHLDPSSKSIAAEPELSLAIHISRETSTSSIRYISQLGSLFLLVFLSFSMFKLAMLLVQSPLLRDIHLREFLGDICHVFDEPDLHVIPINNGHLLLLGVSLLPFYYLTLFILLRAILSSSSGNYTAKLSSVKDMFRLMWKQPMIIYFYMILTGLSFLTTFFTSVSDLSSMYLVLYGIFLSIVVIVSLGACCVYFVAPGMMSVIVSVIDDEDRSTLKAIDRAIDVVKSRRSTNCLQQVHVIEVLVFAAAGAAFMVFVSECSSEVKQGSWRRNYIKVIEVGFINVLEILLVVMYPVIYVP